ncbi:MAG: hypothetical protein IT290_04895 [Deltaproteobacteria bacterium]|nr:hypothetical protein [Deltaproteobacteria bacterium]
MRYLLPSFEMPPMYAFLPLALLLLFLAIVKKSSPARGSAQVTHMERLPLSDDSEE